MPRVHSELSFINNKLVVDAKKKNKSTFTGSLTVPTRTGDVVNFNFTMDTSVPEISAEGEALALLSEKQQKILINKAIKKIADDFGVMQDIPLKSFNVVVSHKPLNGEAPKKEKVAKAKKEKPVKEKATKVAKAKKEKVVKEKAPKVVKEKAVKSKVKKSRKAIEV